MNCLEFRRRITAEPHSHDPELLAHRDECAQCMAFWQRAQRFEDELAEAMAVPVPAGLADRILLAQATGVRRQQVVRRRGWMALAASVLIAVGGGTVMWKQAQAGSLPALAVAHMPIERAALALTQPIGETMVVEGFAERGTQMRGPMPAGVTYVHDCQVGPYKAVHVVTRVDDQPVVALYMPGKMIDKSDDFSRDGWTGREIPLNNGTLVVLAQNANPRALDAAEAGWRMAIDGAGGPVLTQI
ncbi:uncharacterized protein DUF3379 [Luteibacter rhizovicinus]|uniref:Uncharacterized protein DUF3379 n=1 Tax=Luteibacter rhizovicinus TaxID=242606 RepID=A0A4R3YKY7_9GAMM|nr:DUF3379 family protein [Luteibacter rhizovicinus]TCV92812.1 uncharacterized protein DUF3379 [Luteibacter rhizovicinus]